MLKCLIIESYADRGMVYHLPDECGIPVLRHDLVLVLEIRLLIGEPDGNALQDTLVNLTGAYSPLLRGIEAVVLVEEELGIITDNSIIAIEELNNGR